MLTINDMPNRLELTCTVTGVKKVWTVKECMLKAALKHGSLEAFVAQYTSKGAKKKSAPVKAKVIKPILEQGVQLGKLTKDEYTTKYVTREYVDQKTGIVCTVTAPATVGDIAAGRI